MPFYGNPIDVGLKSVASLGDGYSITMSWYRAYPESAHTKIAYNIYFSTIKEFVYSEGIKYVSIDDCLSANIIDLTPGQDYFFSVRPIEYDPTMYDLSILPVAYDNLRCYPHSLLRSNISATDTIIPLLDVDDFDNTGGVIKIGVELIEYATVDLINNNLIVDAGSVVYRDATLVDNDGSYYSAAPTNVGTGTIQNLTLVNTNVPENNWQILCTAVVDGYAIFSAISEIFSNVGIIYDSDGKSFLWTANGSIVSNGVLSFNIVQTTPLAVGDSFYIPVQGASPLVTPGGRGFAGYQPREHTIGGYDGYHNWSPVVSQYVIGESLKFDRIYICQSRFEYPHFAHTILDGFKQVPIDYLSTDLSAADEANVHFTEYDYAGWHRTDLVQLIDGSCVGSYIGGEMGVIDGYGNYNILRGFSLQDQNTQRQDLKLTLDGRPAILIKRAEKGVVCSCYLASSENSDDRCPFCYGTKFIFGYEQYHNPRLSSGHIRVRTSPTEESLKRQEAGLESEFSLDMWTLTVPTIKTRDVIVLFDQNMNEEFRYEVMGVTRNNTMLGLQGGQLLKTMRVRKTDPIYQIRVVRDTSDFPRKLRTSLGFFPGLAPHTHEIVVNLENITSISQINQTTDKSQNHNHPIVNGQVMEVLGHTHRIILPRRG